MSGAACKRFFQLSPGADTRDYRLARRGFSPFEPAGERRCRFPPTAIAARAQHEVNDLGTVSRISPNVGEHEGSISSFRSA